MNVTRKTVAGSSFLSGEESKDPDGKGFKVATTTTNRLENGIWVCDKARFGDDFDGGGSAETKNLSERDFGSGKFGPLVDGNGEILEDSEMNGVSSLLEMQQSGRYPGLDSVLTVIDNNESNGDGNDVDYSKHTEPSQGHQHCAYDNVHRVTEGKKDFVNEEDSEEEMYENEFDVGDFVWGKIKSHPWWPGRVYDPLDASEYATKVKHRGDKILVAYFGDETFAWCNPSQLKPFHENFVEMSNQSTSRNFVNAVEKALEEVGRSVDLRLTCSCVPRDNLFGFGRYLAANAGVKDGLLVPEDGVEKFMDDLFDPKTVFTSVRGLARVCKFDNVFDLVVLKSSLSAFYRAKGGIQLPVYYEPQPVPGLEDGTQKWTNVCTQTNIPEGGGTYRGPVEEDWLSSSSPRGSEFSRDSLNSLQITQLHRRRKRKSIAKIISGSPNAEDEPVMKDDATKVEERGCKTVSKRKKRTSQSDLTGDVAVGVIGQPASSGIKKRRGSRRGTEEMVGSSHKATDVTEVEANSGWASVSSVVVPKKSKGSDDIVSSGLKNSKGGNEVSSSGIRKNGVKEADAKGSRTKGGGQVSSGLKRSKDGKGSNPKSIGDLGRKRKKDGEVSEFSPAAADNRISNPEADAGGVKKRNITTPSTWRSWKEDIGVKNDESGPSIIQSVDTKGKGTIDISPRERKKSWYLSPPFTNLPKGQRTKVVEAEDLTEATAHGSNGVNSGELLKEQASVHEIHFAVSGHMLKDDNPAAIKAEARAAVSEMLCHIRSAACDPLHAEESKDLDEILGFVSEMRSAGHGDGPNIGLSFKPRRGRKKKKPEESEANPIPDLKSGNFEEAKKLDRPEIKKVPDGKANDQGSQSRKSVAAGDGSNLESSVKARRGRKKKIPEESESNPTSDLKSQKIEEAKKSSKPGIKQVSNVSDRKANDQKSESKKAVAATLLVTFGPGSSLPTKGDLLRIYGRYEALHVEETDMLVNNRCARVAFSSTSEAEEALKHSQQSNPFEATHVNFRLRYPSSTGTKGVKKIAAVSESSGTNPSELHGVVQRLEMVSTMLKSSDEMSDAGLKSRVEGEIRGVIEKLSTMVRSGDST